MKNRQIYSKSCYKQVKFKVKLAQSAAQLWSTTKSIKKVSTSAIMCKLVVMILIILTLLCNYLMIVFYKCLWVSPRQLFLFSRAIPIKERSSFNSVDSSLLSNRHVWASSLEAHVNRTKIVVRKSEAINYTLDRWTRLSPQSQHWKIGVRVGRKLS